MTFPVVLTIAGTDPTSGAGLQADCKTITTLGGYAVSAITAVVAQNTQGVSTFEQVDAQLLCAQLDSVRNDTHINAIKIGMLGSTTAIETVHSWIEEFDPSCQPPIVIDPVMVATSGDSLFDPRALDALKNLIKLATVVTPNTSELATLTAQPEANTFAEAIEQGLHLAKELDVHVVVKGGHLGENPVQDAIISSSGTIIERTSHTRVPTHRTHGTGCALSSAIATKLAFQPAGLGAAFTEARAWLQHTIAQADALAFGKGNGPIHHTAHITDEAVTAPARILLAGRDPRQTLAGWWEASTRVRAQIDELRFVMELGTGTLPDERFAYYLQQDALYLREYSKALALAADLAPTLTEQRFWMQGAHTCLIAERQLHDSWLVSRGVEVEDIEPSAITRAYTRHFLNAGRARRYEELIAAVLPCYWVYQDVGDRLNREHNRVDHPYRNWLAAYSDPRFETSTLSARAIVAHHVERAAMRGDEGLIARMYDAFLASCEYERDFFDQAYAADVVLPSVSREVDGLVAGV
jgi:hydroxymethylpyrimidine/phosphomethylpyrimidine kinase/hydroxymethylpyrimidine kinase/phosphomethylpyrimidine kinase/thiamine-phosphate diphosphorylase